MSGKISVLIPTYNVGAYLAETIRSVLAQTRPADEIIIVDDCSTDNSFEIAKSFSDPRMKVLSTGKNSGSALARNLGVKAAKNELIALLDGDDIWLEDHLETVAALLDEHPTASLAFSATEAFGSEQWVWPMVIAPNEPVNCFWQCIPRTVIPQMNVILRRQAFDAVNGYRVRMRQTQDFDLFLRMAYRSPFICTHKVTSKYRRHNSSITWMRPKNALRGHYLARHLFWLENKATMDPQTLARFETAARDVWVQHLANCASRMDFDMLNFHVSQFRMIPGSAEPYRHFKRIKRIESIRPAWERLPLFLRNGTKAVVQWVRPGQTTASPAATGPADPASTGDNRNPSPADATWPDVMRRGPDYDRRTS